MSTEPHPLELLALDVDTRTCELWTLLGCWLTDAEPAPADEFVPTLMRAAYAQGYIDALKEDAKGERGALLREHGYELL